MTLLDCPVCTQSKFTLRFTKKDRKFWRCNACGLEKQHPLPTTAELEAYYDESYASGMYESFAAATQMKELTAAARIDQIKRLVPLNGRWLDVGCANGTFVKAAKHHEIDCEGIELSTNAVRLAQSEGLPVTQGSLDSLPSHQRYHCITAFDVLEHVIDPVAFMTDVTHRLLPDGYAVFTLPNLRSWPARLMGKNWYFYIPEEHLHYFCPENLSRLAANCGLQAISVKSTYKPLTIHYSLIQFAEYNPWIYKMLSLATWPIPQSLKHRSIPLHIGEMMLIARRRRLAAAA